MSNEKQDGKRQEGRLSAIPDEDTKRGRGSWMMFLCPIGWCHTHKQKAFYIDGTGKVVCNLTAELVRCSVEERQAMWERLEDGGGAIEK